jgi:putative spermidine/putrescine transport system permease protein
MISFGRNWRSSVLVILAWTVLGFLLAPTLIVFPVSLTDRSYLALPDTGVSLEHWRDLVNNASWAKGFVDSFVVASVSTIIAVISGTLCTIACWRASSWITETVRLLTLMPLVIPTIVYALGLYRFYSSLNLLDSYAGLVVAHAALGTSYVVLTTGAALADFDRRLEHAARNLGASLSQTIWWIVVPGILPGILSGAIFAFVNSWDELVIALFIASRRVTTLPRLIWNGIHESLDPSIAAVAAVLIIATVLLLLPTLKLRSQNTGSDV